jgi:putative transposase
MQPDSSGIRQAGTGINRTRVGPPLEGFCQYALNSGTTTVNATELASDTYVSAERESTDRPTASAVGS